MIEFILKRSFLRKHPHTARIQSYNLKSTKQSQLIPEIDGAQFNHTHTHIHANRIYG